MEEKNTHPYPSRITEFLGREKPFPKVEPLVLTQERGQVLEFEAELFEELEPLRQLTPGIHTVYPGYFLTEEGWRKAVEVYGEIDKKVENLEQPRDIGEAADFFFRIQIADLSLEKRKEIWAASMRCAREEFLSQILEAEGDLEKVDDPLRISRVVDLTALKEKAAGYRELKREIKKMEKEMAEKEGELAEAKRIVLRLYRRYLNVLIAGLYSQGVVLARQPGLSSEEKKVLTLIRGRELGEEAKKDRLAYPGATRTLERLDHFLRGVGLRIDEDGFWTTIPGELSQYIEKKCEQPWEESEEYRRYKK